MNEETFKINNNNVQNIRGQIDMKKGHNPFFATGLSAQQVLTDYDTFPYPRWFRGVPQSTRPIVAEREAGWRNRNDNCYKLATPVEVTYTYPNTCFEGPCSLVLPCYSNSKKSSSKRELNNVIDNMCMVQYR